MAAQQPLPLPLQLYGNVEVEGLVVPSGQRTLAFERGSGAPLSHKPAPDRKCQGFGDFWLPEKEVLVPGQVLP